MRYAVLRKLIFASFPLLIRSLVPVIAFPYISRTLGLTEFASFASGLSIAMVAAILVEYGFGLMAVRHLSGGNPNRQSSTVGVLLLGKALASLGTAIILSVIHLASDFFADVYIVIIVSALAIAQGHGPSWYYIAQERYKVMAALEAVSSLATFTLLFFLLRPDVHVSVVLSCFLIPQIVFAAYGTSIAIRTYGLTMPSLRELGAEAIENTQYFVLTGLPAIANRLGVVLLGFVASAADVAIFAAAEKISTAIINTVQPVNRVFLPSLLKEKAVPEQKLWASLDIVLMVSFFTYCLIAMILAYFSNYISHIFFPAENSGAYVEMALYFLVIPFAAINRIMSQTVFIVLDDIKFCSQLNVASSLAFMITAVPAATLGGSFCLIITKLFFDIVSAFVLVARYIIVGRKVI